MIEKPPGDTPEDTVDFGFREVPTHEKAPLVRGIFDSVASRYDLMNDLMSLGVHRLWKAAMVDWLRPRAGQNILDVAGGTGDIAMRIVERTDRAARVTVCDINQSMLEVGRGRLIDRGVLTGVEWLAGDAEKLPVGDMTMDAYTIAFGIRNVTDIAVALREARRVLKPGGRFLCLEFSHIALPGLADLYDAYSFKVLPEIGARVAGDRAAYEYLAESIRRFPDQQTFAGMIADAGLGQVKVRDLSGGVAALHSAWRI